MSLQTPDTQASLALVAALARSHGALMRELDREIATHQLTQPQFAVLEILRRRGPLPLHEVGKELLVSGGNVTCVVDNLEKAGLVARERDTQDRRVIKAGLTPAGEERLLAMLPAYQARVGALSAGLTDVEQGILTQLLRKLADTLAP